MSKLSVALPLSLLGVVVAVIAGSITWSVLASRQLGDGPAAIVWDKAACAACGMHVGEPPFAAQVTTKDGRVHAFDDPGCLFLWVEEHRPDVHSTFFRHHAEDRWIRSDAVAFVPADKTPMGFGIAAVDANVRGAIDFDEARRKCLERSGGHGGAR
jgi:copper chaperone NosL